MSDIKGGKYPVYLPLRNGALLRVAYVDGTIKAVGDEGEFTFMSGGKPLEVEDAPFAIAPDGGTFALPCRLLVHLTGSDGLTEIVSTDGCRTWWDMESYRHGLEQMYGSSQQPAPGG